jgi:uncharacterized membrane protein YgcG
MTETAIEHDVDDLDEVVATTPEQRREQALRRVKQRREFRAHLTAYVAVNVALWGIWAVIGAASGSWFPWPAFVSLAWGIGLFMNAWEVYFRRPISEEEIRREMDRLDARS